MRRMFGREGCKEGGVERNFRGGTDHYGRAESGEEAESQRKSGFLEQSDSQDSHEKSDSRNQIHLKN